MRSGGNAVNNSGTWAIRSSVMFCLQHAVKLNHGISGSKNPATALVVTNSLSTGVPRVGEMRIFCVAAIIPVRIRGGLFMRL